MKHFTPKRLYSFTFTLLALMSAMSCQKSALVSENPEAAIEPSFELAATPKISADIVDLTENDAVIVANLFLQSSSVKTKSSGTLPVKEVITIRDSNGEPAIYAVNYADGYVLVSATKKYCPVLAEVEHGNFSLASGTGQDVLVGDYVKDIEYAKKESFVTQERNKWRLYEEQEKLDVVRTRVAKDDYYDMLETYLDEWYRDGRKVYYMRNKPENMPEDLYELFCTIAHDDMGDMPGYSYLDCAIITEKEYDYVSETGPLLQTQWGQGWPFNLSLNADNPLGCFTIATGQIMRYHEYPAKYAWGSMPDYTSNTVLSDFLKELHDALKIDDSGTGYLNDVETVFKKYQYNCNTINHNSSKMERSLYNKNPIFMYGWDSSKGEGHGWVCDGSITIQPRTDYRMYELIFYYNEPYMMDEFASETIFGNSYTRYHMNWGWTGKNNGYFYDNSLRVPLNGTHYNFNSNRKELIVSKK
ncbi:MAG: C10 family peptidase [Bacteroidales bacterium]|nr:C10 family peptidase [Bacteroidales bacterium]